MAFRAVITDLDGTLLNSSHKVSSFTTETLKLLQSKGIPIILASGRPHPDVLHTVNSCGLKGGYIISSNGARVLDPERNFIFSHDLDPSVVTELTQIQIPSENNNNNINNNNNENSKPPFLSINMYRHDEWVTNNGQEWMLAAYANSGFHYKLVEDISKYANDGVHELFFVGLHETLLRVEEILKSRFTKRIEFTFPIPNILDAVHPGVHKGKAMTEVAKLLGIECKDIIAFGDGMNDLKMLEMAGKGCIMRNGQDILKQALPNMEVIGTNDEDSVAKRIREEFKL